MKDAVQAYFESIAIDTLRRAVMRQLEALDELAKALEQPVEKPAKRRVVKRRAKARRPKREQMPPAIHAAADKVFGDSNDAARRRELLLSLIGRVEAGTTTGALRKLAPNMKPGDRQNALQALKVRGLIRRVGNVWVKAA